MPSRRRPDPPLAADDRAFLESYRPDDYERPSVAVDVVLLTVSEGALRTLLIRRTEQPARGAWSLPGGFVGMAESLDVAAARVLETKAGLKRIFLEQLYTFGQVKRDPRMRVISVAYYALVDEAIVRGAALAVSDARRVVAEVRVPWDGIAGGPVQAVAPSGASLPLAFDHEEILATAVRRIRGKLDYTPIGFQLLPKRFTLRRLQEVHETILGRSVNKDAFRRRMCASGQLHATGTLEDEVGHRPAELYEFRERAAI